MPTKGVLSMWAWLKNGGPELLAALSAERKCVGGGSIYGE